MTDGTIFINYRRDDSRGDAGRLYDRLHALYPGRVFRDVGFLEPGVRWHEAIAKVLGEADACIVVIGRRWLSVTDSAGKRRLDSPRDTVRQEILTALNNGMRIFPVLVGDADMPAEEELPTDLQPLAQRNAIELSEQSWDEDFNRLAAAIERSLGWSPATGADVGPTGPGPATSAGRVAPEIAARSANAPPYERTKSTRGVLLALAVVLLAGGLGFAAFRGGHLPWADPPRPQAEIAGSVNATRAATGTATPGAISGSSTPAASATIQPSSVPLPQSIGVESPSAKQPGAPAAPSGRGSTPRLPPRPASTETVGRSGVTDRRPETTPVGSAAADQVSQRPSNSESSTSVAVRARQSAGSPERPPQNPTVFLQCAGALEVCAALRTAFDHALEKESLPGVRSLDRAEIAIDRGERFSGR